MHQEVFVTNMITNGQGTTTNATDVATKSYVDSQLGGTRNKSLNTPNTLVKREDGTGSFAAQIAPVLLITFFKW